MKKITLALFAVVCSIGYGYSQLNYTVVAPPNQAATSSLRAPNGTSAHAFQRSVMYIHPYELLPMNISSITSVGFQYLSGTGTSSVSGNFTLYLQNTTDFAYAKGATFSGALAGMQTSYIGTYTVPASTGPATITIPLTTPFGFTGDGLYVAWDYTSTGPFATTAASMACSNNFNNVGEVWIGTGDALAPGPVTNTLGGSNFRPALIFKATNTATNEIEALDIIAPGEVAKLFNTPETIITNVVNSSIGAQNNVTVGLTATGANPYTATQTLNMAPGSVTSLTWNAYNPTTNGQSTITVGVLLNDQNIANNTKSWTQSVTCNEIAQNPPTPNFTSSFGFGGTSGSGCFLSKHVIPTSCSLTSIKANIGSSTTNGATTTLYGVLVDATGAILATSSNTVNLTPSSVVNLNFNNVALTGGTTYYMGVAQPSNGYYPLAYATNTTFVPQIYYSVPLAGGTLSQALDDGYFGIAPAFSFSSIAVHASATKTIVCKKDGPNTVTLTATGLSTYTWTGGATGSLIAVTPSIAGTSTGVVVYTVTGTDGVSGCKSSAASIIVTVSNCTGLASNTSNGYDLKVFPNPSVNGKSTITGLTGTNYITVFNSLGQIVSNQHVTEETTSIDLSSQPSGNYLIKITDDNSESRTIKVVNQN